MRVSGRGVRQAAGFGAAGTMALYLVVKVIWVAVALVSGRSPMKGVRTADWVALNAFTVVMAAVGIALGLALAQPWGFRLPAAPVIFFSWMASGFLVSLLPYLLATGVLTVLGHGPGGGAGQHSPGAHSQTMAGWEAAFIMIGFTGMGLGLTIALPLYLRERWPHAFKGTTASRDGRIPKIPVMAATGCLALLWLSWALGAKVGLNPAFPNGNDAGGRVLLGIGAVWALLGGWSLWTLSGRGTVRPLWLPMTLGFVGSGSLFAWSLWKAPFAVLRPDGYQPFEHPAVAAVEHTVSMAAGAAILVSLIRIGRRRAAARDQG